MEASFETLPVTLKVPIKDAPGTPSADLKLVAEVVYEDNVLTTRTIGVARVEKLAERVEAIRKAAKEVQSPPTTIEQASFKLLASLLVDLAGGKDLGDGLSHVAIGLWRRAAREGQGAVLHPVASGRVLARYSDRQDIIDHSHSHPAEARRKEATSADSFALHGLTGSENLFFDGYGNGIIPRLATERGWIVVATRVSGPLSSEPAPDVVGILNELSKRYPIDPKRVYLLGHSLGAAHAVQLAQKHPGKFAAIAALSGGAGVTTPEAIKDLPIFVGCGKLDFALPAAKSLHKSLEDAKAKVTFKEYEDIEHFLIVREAAGDVFRFLDKSK